MSFAVSWDCVLRRPLIRHVVAAYFATNNQDADGVFVFVIISRVTHDGDSIKSTRNVEPFGDFSFSVLCCCRKYGEQLIHILRGCIQPKCFHQKSGQRGWEQGGKRLHLLGRGI